MRLLATRAASLAADGMLQVALASAVFFTPERATSAGQAAAGFAVLLLPYSVAGPAFLLTALAALSLGRLLSVTAAAALPHLVAAQRLASANSIWTVIGLAAGFTGAAVGLTIRNGGGAGDTANATAMVAASAVYVLSSLIAAGFAADTLGPDDGKRAAASTLRRSTAAMGRDLANAARLVRSRVQVAAAIVAIAGFRFCYGISTIATLLLYRNYFTDSGWLRAGVAGAAQVVAAVVAGSLLAAAITPAIVRRWQVRKWIVMLLAMAAVTQVVLGVPYRMGPLLAAAVVLGMVAQATRICVDTVVQRQVPDELRGRVFSFYDTLFNMSFVAAAVVGAVALPDSGKSYPMLTIIAAGYALLAAGYAVTTGFGGDA